MAKPDRTAHLLGVLGFALSMISIGWQVFVYQDTYREHIITRITAVYHTGFREVDPSGDVLVEIVNAGQRPLYLREVWLRDCGGGQIWELYGRDDAGKTQKATLKMGPGETHTFQQKHWNFVVRPLDGSRVCLYVQSTKGIYFATPARASETVYQ